MRLDSAESVKAILALGSNLGDSAGQLRAAIASLQPFLSISAVSSVYLTEPVGGVAQPDYHNIVLVGDTDLPVYSLHTALHRIEAEMGRERHDRNGPRTIDIDLIAYGELSLRSADLTVPHPRFAERSFVLEPLAEIAPDWRDPVSGREVSTLLSDLATPTRVRRLAAL